MAILLLLVTVTGWPMASQAAPQFSHETVKELAEALSKKAYQPRKMDVENGQPPLTYDEFRNIQFDSDQAIWKKARSAFQLQLFAPGGLYNMPVSLHLVERGKVKPLDYSGHYFRFGDLIRKARPEIVRKLSKDFSATRTPQKPDGKTPDAKAAAPGWKPDDVLAPPPPLTFSGFRVHGFINNKRFREEFAVFQGASYFRATGYKQNYGLSARGLAINTAEPSGEEFPYFRAFWIEQPGRRGTMITVHGLLDSPSLTGAYRFRIRPGRETVIDVDATLYPRGEVGHVGLAPLTSMFQFGDGHSRQFDDYRPAVHDSEGLLIHNGRDEWLWRPLRNPARLQVSSFVDVNPQGFGLMQRNRSFDSYRDLEARYDRRPSLWIQPKGKWGKGAVMLYEIPTEAEINDNIVAMWKPEQSLKQGTAYDFSYRMYWGERARGKRPKARIANFMTGAAHGGRVLFVIDFVGKALKNAKLPKVKAETSKGEITNVVVLRNSVTNGYRATFLLDHKSAESADIRLSLRDGEKDLSEIFLYRWTNDK